MDQAPLHNTLARGPAGGQAYWLTTSDRVRIRAALWPGADAGTVLLFPGRTEYAEKYGLAAAALVARGLTVLTVDWRGQGLADRLTDDPALGHVERFLDYQYDVAAMIALANRLDLPRPWHLLGHSMGGAIGLRALYSGLPVSGATFSAPMWGIQLAAGVRPVALPATWAASRLGAGRTYAPGTSPGSYVLTEPFEENMLTSDPEMYALMRQQAAALPQVVLGGPSMHWVHEALRENRDLARRLAPPVPAVTFIGSQERIVDPRPVYTRMEGWTNGNLVSVSGARHEIPMEAPATRTRLFDTVADQIAAARGA